MAEDLIVIGGGPGGYVAAIRGAQLGMKVMLIEEEKLGGTCLNWGCIPTKALYRSAQMIHTLENCGEFGLQLAAGFRFDLAQAQRRKETVVQKLADGIRQVLAAYKVEVIYGRGRLAGGKNVAVTRQNGEVEIRRAEHILLATGSQPAILPIPGIDLPGVLTSKDVLALGELPKSMVIIGGGVVGIEFAGILHSFGVAVTVIEYLPRILPSSDEEMVRRLTMALKKSGIKIETGTAVSSISSGESGLLVQAVSKSEERVYEAEKVLSAAGRSLFIDGLDLNAAGVQFNRQGIEVDGKFMTNIDGIYAIGDVIGGMMLAHAASDEGRAAVENMAGLPGHVNYDAVPSCVFSFPELAAVGFSEERAKLAGIPCRTGKFLFGANGKALAMGEGEGLVKVIAHGQTGKIIGVHILGPHASDLIHEGVLAVEKGLTALELGRTVHAHPTLAEALMEAALAVEDQAIHLVPPRK